MLQRSVTQPIIIIFDLEIRRSSHVFVFAHVPEYLYINRHPPFYPTPCRLSSDWVFWLVDEHKRSSRPLSGFCPFMAVWLKWLPAQPDCAFHSAQTCEHEMKREPVLLLLLLLILLLPSPVDPAGAGHLKVRSSLWCWSVSSLASWYIQCLRVVFSESGLVSCNTSRSQPCVYMSV